MDNDIEEIDLQEQKSQLCGSTTLKTVRNMKLRQSFMDDNVSSFQPNLRSQEKEKEEENQQFVQYQQQQQQQQLQQYQEQQIKQQQKIYQEKSNSIQSKRRPESSKKRKSLNTKSTVQVLKDKEKQQSNEKTIFNDNQQLEGLNNLTNQLNYQNNQQSGNTLSTKGSNSQARILQKQQSAEDSTLEINQNYNQENQYDSNQNGVGISQDNGKSFIRSKRPKVQTQVQPNQIPEKMEYFNIDMKMATEYVITKSKTLKEYIDLESLTTNFVNEGIVNNKTFQIAYNSYLQKLCNLKLMNYQFKNMQVKTFNKLEKFFMERLKSYQDKIKLHYQYKEQSEEIKNSFKRRMREIKDQIEYERKAEWNIE